MDKIQDSTSETAPGRHDAPSRAPAPKPRRPVPPWLLIILGAFFFCVVFGIIVGVAVFLLPAKRQAARGLQECRLPDGTVLVLEAVTTGTNHRFEWEQKRTFTEWLNGNWSLKRTTNMQTPSESIMVWFSRHDPVTGACLDVDWWLRSAAVDDLGAELDDDHAGRDSFSVGGSSGLSGSRPFSAVPPGKYELIVARSAIVPFRHSGNSFQLRVYDTKGDRVGEFDVPHTMSATLPIWAPEPLPSTKKADDLDFNLTGLTVDSRVYNAGAGQRAQYNVLPVFTITRNGEAEKLTSFPEFELEDVFGNVGHQWDCRLNFNEPAWKLKVKLWPGEGVPSDPAAEWSMPGVAVPEAGKASLIRQTKILRGVTVEFIAAGGADKVIYTDAAPGGGGGSSSSGGSFGGSSYNVEVRIDHGIARTTVNCKLPHLLLRVTGADPDHRLVVRVRDDQGRDVPVQQAYVSDLMVVFLQTAADVRSLDVSFVVQQPKKVEFWVKPPRIERKVEPDKARQN